jgi:hypothetical protein
MINSYIRHRLQLPVSDMTKAINKTVAILFSKKRAKLDEATERRLVDDAEHQIKELFTKYGHLLK